MNKIDIEFAARDLQAQIWRQRGKLWPDGAPRPVEMLHPAIAAGVLGVNFEQQYELSLSSPQIMRSEIAGLLHRQAKKIAVATKFSMETVRFTAAHEIGHWLLHPDEVMHRDRPIKGLTEETTHRLPVEREADYFAACFLMPRRLLTRAFEITFSTKAPFVVNDDTAFMLCPSDPDSVLRAEAGSLDCALALASAISFAGRPFNSLASQFRVSVTTMAIRLREVGLIQE